MWTSKPKTGGLSGKCQLGWQSRERQRQRPEYSCTSAMKHLSGLKLLEEREGEGTPANKGDRVVCNSRLFLNKRDEVLLSPKLAEYIPKEMFRVEGGITFVDDTAVLGSRQVIAGIEHALMA